MINNDVYTAITKYVEMYIKEDKSERKRAESEITVEVDIIMK